MPRRGDSDLSYRLTRADLTIVAAALLRVLPRAITKRKRRPVRVSELLRLVGGKTQTERVSRLAMALSGAAGRRGTAYKTARRAVERQYAAEQGGGPRGGKQLRGTTEKGRRGFLERVTERIERPHLPERVGLGVQIVGSPYGSSRTVEMPAGGATVMGPETLGGVRDALAQGDELGAARALLDQWVLAYRLTYLPNADGVVGPIEAARIEVIG